MQTLPEFLQTPSKDALQQMRRAPPAFAECKRSEGCPAEAPQKILDPCPATGATARRAILPNVTPVAIRVSVVTATIGAVTAPQQGLRSLVEFGHAVEVGPDLPGSRALFRLGGGRKEHCRKDDHAPVPPCATELPPEFKGQDLHAEIPLFPSPGFYPSIIIVAYLLPIVSPFSDIRCNSDSERAGFQGLGNLFLQHFPQSADLTHEL